MRNIRSVTYALLLMGFQHSVVAQENRCESVAECAQKAMEAAYQAKLTLQTAIPKGAIIPFNRAECPAGWKAFAPLAGRVVVGAGSASGIAAKTLGQQGGAETHTLTVAQMPSHAHTYSSTNNGQLLDNGRNFPARPRYGIIANKTTTAQGGGQPHNNLQPYHVLTYCERE